MCTAEEVSHGGPYSRNCRDLGQLLVQWRQARGSGRGLSQLVSENVNTCAEKTDATFRESVVAVLTPGFFSEKDAGFVCRTGHWNVIVSVVWLLLIAPTFLLGS